MSRRRRRSLRPLGVQPLEPRMVLAGQDYLGDANFDGAVDIFDVAVVSNHWGAAGPIGDVTGDGAVDVFDIAAISSNWTTWENFSPKLLAPTLWFDANHDATIATDGAAKLVASQGDYLRLEDSPAFDFTTQFSFSFWLHQTTQAVDQVIMSKWSHPSQASWAVNTSGSYGKEDELRIYLSGTPQVGTVPFVDTLNANLNRDVWRHIVIVFDGLEPTATRVRVYVDGAAVETEASETPLPNSVALTNQPIYLGRMGGSLTRFFSGSVDRLGMWNRTLSAGEAASLYNAANGREYGDLTAGMLGGLVGYWDFSEPSGQSRVDAHNGHVFSDPNSGVERLRVVNSWRELGENGLVLSEDRQLLPTLASAAINGRDAVFFDGVDDVLAASIADTPNTPSGDMFLVFKLPDDIDENTFHTILNSSDEQGVSRYFFWEAYAVKVGEYPDGDPIRELRFRIRWRLDGWHNSLVGQTKLSAGGVYLVHVWSDGADLSSYQATVNGIPQQWTGGTAPGFNGAWYADIAGRDNVTLGALRRLDGDTDRGRILLAEAILYPRLATEDADKVHDYLAQRWGVPVASSSAATAAAQIVEAGDLADASSQSASPQSDRARWRDDRVVRDIVFDRLARGVESPRRMSKPRWFVAATRSAE